MVEQAGRPDAGRAWVEGTLSAREFFARARREAWPTWRDRLRAWRGGQRP